MVGIPDYLFVEGSEINNNSPLLLSRGIELFWDNPKWRIVWGLRVTNNPAVVLSFSLQNDLVCRIVRIPILFLGNHFVIHCWISVLDQMSAAKSLAIKAENISVVICPPKDVILLFII